MKVYSLHLERTFISVTLYHLQVQVFVVHFKGTINTINQTSFSQGSISPIVENMQDYRNSDKPM